MALTLIYWPTLPGRGEYARLLLEALELPYRDLGRSNGVRAVLAQRGAVDPGPPGFAPPMLIDDSTEPPRRVAQTAAVLQYIDDVYGPFGDPAIDRYAKLHLNLTLLDIVAEAHDTHHPIDVSLTYEQQADAALARARAFQQNRIPRFLSLLEQTARDTGGDGLLGGLCVVDLVLAHTIRGLQYAFPAATAATLRQTPRIAAITDAALAVPAVAAYRASDRFLAFDETGIFRHYAELQDPAFAAT